MCIYYGIYRLFFFLFSGLCGVFGRRFGVGAVECGLVVLEGYLQVGCC
jgi:hypothetical protein